MKIVEKKWVRWQLILSLMVVLGLFACQKPYLLNEKKIFSNAVWAYADTADFKLTVQDTTKIYNLELELNHSIIYPHQNIYLNIYTQFPSGKRFKKQVNIDFAENDGKWVGKCDKNTCNVVVTLQKNTFFNEKGDYLFTIVQNTRTDSLSGIKSIAFSVQEALAPKN